MSAATPILTPPLCSITPRQNKSDAIAFRAFTNCLNTNLPASLAVPLTLILMQTQSVSVKIIWWWEQIPFANAQLMQFWMPKDYCHCASVLPISWCSRRTHSSASPLCVPPTSLCRAVNANATQTPLPFPYTHWSAFCRLPNVQLLTHFKLRQPQVDNQVFVNVQQQQMLSLNCRLILRPVQPCAQPLPTPWTTLSTPWTSANASLDSIKSDSLQWFANFNVRLLPSLMQMASANATKLPFTFWILASVLPSLPLINSMEDAVATNTTTRSRSHPCSAALLVQPSQCQTQQESADACKRAGISKSALCPWFAYSTSTLLMQLLAPQIQ